MKIFRMKLDLPLPSPSQDVQLRHLMTKVRLKWVKSRGLDHIIARDTTIKSVILIKDLLLRSPPPHLLSIRSLSPLQKTLGLTLPLLRFLRRYPTLFSESPHPRFPSLPSFSPTPPSLLLHNQETLILSQTLTHLSQTLAKLLMMTSSRSLPVSTLFSLRYDLGLPDNFLTSVVSTNPQLFTTSRRKSDGCWCVSLSSWPQHLAVSAVQLRHQHQTPGPNFKSCSMITFPMKFPKGYGSMKKVRSWMEEFDKLPYISPYEDCSGIDPESDLMEKRVVGVLHEVLSLTVHKKTKRNYLRGLREEMRLPHKFTRVFTRYPGIFYLSLKCKTTTVMLREAYDKGRLVEPCRLALLRDKYYYVMRTGVLYRGKGMSKLVLDDDDANEESLVGREGAVEENFEGSGDDDDDEYYEINSSDIDDSGSEED